MSSARRLTTLGFLVLLVAVLVALTVGPGHDTAAWAAKASQCTSGGGTTAQAVCVAAESFATTLSSAQQGSLYYSLTTANEERWSNLPCGSNCRNGIQFSTLSSAQLQAALTVAQAALSTAGYGTFDGIRNADDYLAQNGGGSGYSSGIYYIAFLGTPSSTEPWMLQLGGHHYALNFYYHGSFAAPTPYFTGVEPLTFTLNGKTYAPMQNKADTTKAMLAGLSSSQLASAKLSGSFDDVLVGPGEDGQFPAQSGLKVSTLSADQQTLVVNAIKVWANEMAEDVASEYLANYTTTSALADTYIGWAGGTDLASQGSYIRIDGPRVWIEIVAQGGVVFRNQVHYHSVWRDKLHDYGANEEPSTSKPGTLAFASSTYEAQEDSGTATLRIQRTGGSDGAVSVDYAVSGGTATVGADYETVSGTLTWTDGDSASKSIQVPLIDDVTVENPETVVLTLSDPSGGASLGSPSSSTLTLSDDDTNPGAGTFVFTSTVFRAAEGSGGVTVQVQRTGGSDGAVSVRLAAINGGATAGVDYKLPTMRVLRWADGDSSAKSLRVTFLNDSIKEPSERFQLMLASPTGGATLGTPVTAIVTILNDD